MSNANVTLVQSLYGAFGRGDIGTIVDAVTPDVHWESTGRRSDFPTLGIRRGQNEVREFFDTVGKELKFSEFTPKEFYAAEEKVFVLGHYTMTVSRTGKLVDSDWIHVFTIRNGKVTAFREFLVTAQAAAANR